MLTDHDRMIAHSRDIRTLEAQMLTILDGLRGIVVTLERINDTDDIPGLEDDDGESDA